MPAARGICCAAVAAATEDGAYVGYLWHLPAGETIEVFKVPDTPPIVSVPTVAPGAATEWDQRHL
jgi:hypothetical protein